MGMNADELTKNPQLDFFKVFSIVWQFLQHITPKQLYDM